MRYITSIILLFFPLFALANNCVFSPPKEEPLEYKAGRYLPVLLGGIQFDLPGTPKAFLSTDGLIAAYPDRQFVSHQRVTSETFPEFREIFPHIQSVAQVYRLIYGVEPATALTERQAQELAMLRKVFRLDCKSQVRSFGMADTRILLRELDSPEGIFEILVLRQSHVDLIQVRGPESMALEVVRSIRRSDR